MKFDLRQLPDSFYDDPFPAYRWLRENHPVYQCPDGSWFLSRHADVVQVYRDAASFSSDKQKEFSEKFGDSALFRHHTSSLVFNDPPLHTAVRKRIAASLKPNAVQNMQSAIEALVDSLLDQIATKESFDGIADFAALIPVEVIGNLLGIPREDRDPLRDWSLAILGALEASISDRVFERGNQAVEGFSAYLKQLIESRRREMDNGVDRDDMLTRLIRNNNDSSLSDFQLIQNAIFILNAGHETTTNLIGNGIHELLNTPGAKARLLETPALMPTTVEELLRLQSPNQLGNRITTCEVKVADLTLPAGSRIWLGIGAANRDPLVFEQPDQLIPDRNPNPHVAFAAGTHSCIGLNVARMEARIALSRILHRFPNIYPTQPPIRANRARFRGLTALPLHIGTSQAPSA